MLDSLQVTLRTVSEVTYPSQIPSLRRLLGFWEALTFLLGSLEGNSRVVPDVQGHSSS